MKVVTAKGGGIKVFNFVLAYSFTLLFKDKLYKRFFMQPGFKDCFLKIKLARVGVSATKDSS